MSNDLSKPLAGKTIAVPETRDLESFATMLEEKGATILRCPLVGILDAPDAGPIECWLNELADSSFNDLVLLTGEGLRRLMGVADRVGIREKVIAGLAIVRKITRGPKPAKALVELGMRPDFASAAPTTAGVIETLRQFDLSGRHVGVQLYGENPNDPLIEFLLGAGAHPEPVAPYIYAPASDADRVTDLIKKMADGQVDILAFTSAPQVRRLQEVAETFLLKDVLAEGLKRTRIASVGPVVAEELAKHGWSALIQPQKSFIMKALVNEIVASVSRP